MSASQPQRRIENVAVIDDDPDMRASASEALADAQFHAQPLSGPFPSLDAFVENVSEEADAVVCDHKLNVRNYANFLGAEAVARFYTRHFPAVLVTRYSEADLDGIRRYRRRVPVLLTPDQADPDVIARGFEQCIEEHNDHFRPARKPWRALIRVEEIDEQQQPPMAYVVMPGWNPNEVVRFPIDLIPVDLREHAKPGERFFAKVNEGAEDQADLYFEEFEYRGR